VGLQCPKALWINYNNKALLPEVDAGTEALFDQGHQVGLLAQKLFPDGIDVGHLSGFDEPVESMVAFALEQGWKVNSPRDVNERGGSVMIDVDKPPAMVDRLAKRKVFVDCRPGVGLRISPHFFNTDEEVAEAMTILSQLIGEVSDL